MAKYCVAFGYLLTYCNSFTDAVLFLTKNKDNFYEIISIFNEIILIFTFQFEITFFTEISVGQLYVCM